MAGAERLAKGCLAVGICPRSVEVIAARLEVVIDHFGKLVDVDCVIFAADEAHAAEPELADLGCVNCHVDPLPFLALVPW